MRKKDFSCLRYISKRFLFQKEYLGKKFSTNNFYYYMSLNTFVPGYVRQSFDNVRLFYQRDVEGKQLHEEQERAYKELDNPLYAVMDERRQAEHQLGEIDLEISKLEFRKKKLQEDHPSQLEALERSGAQQLADRRREMQIAYDKAMGEFTEAVQKHREELLAVGQRVGLLQNRIAEVRDQIRPQKIQMQHQHAQERAAFRANEQLLYIYKINGYEYIGIENRKWGIWRRRIICILSLGLLSHWAFSDLDIIRIYGVVHCMLTSSVGQELVYPSDSEKYTAPRQSFSPHVGMVNIIEGSLKPRAKRHHDRRNAPLQAEINLIKGRMRQMYPKPEPSGYVVEDHSMDIADSIRGKWEELVEKAGLLFELRRVDSWGTSHVFSFNPQLSFYNDEIDSGYKWLRYIYTHRRLNVPSEAKAMNLYFDQIKAKAAEFVATVSSVDAPLGVRYRICFFGK